MQETFDDQLLTEGFSSRTFFIFATQNRKNVMWIPELSAEQEKYKQELIDHVAKLAYLYGPVEVDRETKNWLEDWWNNCQIARPNPNIKLNPYYARKNIHVIKLAAAMHFGESVEMKIPLDTFKQTIEFLDKEETKMHYALGLDNNNPLSKPARKILKYIESAGKQTRKALLAEFWNDLPNGVNDLDEILEYLQSMSKLTKVDVSQSGISVTHYDIIRKAANTASI